MLVNLSFNIFSPIFKNWVKCRFRRTQEQIKLAMHQPSAVAMAIKKTSEWNKARIASASLSRVFSTTPKVWNAFPISLSEIETFSFFKKRFKAYYFDLAFDHVTTVWCQYFATFDRRLPLLCTELIFVKLLLWMLLWLLSHMHRHRLVLSQRRYELLVLFFFI